MRIVRILSFCRFCRFRAFGGGKADAVVFCELEERADGDARAVGVEAAVILLVAFLRSVA